MRNKYWIGIKRKHEKGADHEELGEALKFMTQKQVKKLDGNREEVKTFD